jgi:disulfide bond formation protein DsbB
MRKYGLYFAWAIALVGFIFSFYYGELLHIEPCRLCWYQRIALFPLALILGIAAYRDDKGIFRYATPLAFFGLIVALYQALSIHFPVLQGAFECGKECAKPIFILFGWLTFPDLSVIGFSLILVFVFLGRKA